jgi:T5SS/PEP-CTERM-associated repeat protein/autotransporter-associated beta strand protein
VNSGSLSVSGAGSSLTVARASVGDPLLVTTLGNGGTGSVSFSSEGTGAFDVIHVGGSGTGNLTVTSPAAITSGEGFLGVNVGSHGTATVTGFNATWTSPNNFVAGYNGTGALEVRNGGRVSHAQGYVGANAGSNGSVLVTDPASQWTGSGSFFIGNSGTGAIQVLNGGYASTTGNSYLGFVAGASGSATVSGAGSTWSTAVNLNIGGTNAAAGGSGFLRIANGGAVSAALINIWNTGILHLENSPTLTGPLTVTGGTITTFGAISLPNTITLGTGGAIVSTQGASVATFSGGISGVGGLAKYTSGSLILPGPKTYTGATTVFEGKLLLGGAMSSSPSVSVSSGATLELAAGGGALVKTDTLTILGTGKANVQDNKLVVRATPFGSWNGSNYTGLTGLIQSGHNGGAWNGPGIITGMPAALSSLTTLGIATASQAGYAGGSFGGVSVTGTDTLIMYTYAGDANLSGDIDADDYANIDFNSGTGATGYFNGDFNYDGGINADDYALIDFNFNAQGAPFPTSDGLATRGVAAVPEPSGWLLATLAAVACSPRARRRGS